MRRKGDAAARRAARLRSAGRDFLYAGRAGSLIDSELRRIVCVNCASLVGSIYLTGFGVVALAKGRIALAIALGLGCAVAIALVVWLRRGAAVSAASNTALAAYSALVLFLLFDGGITGGATYSLFLIPVLALFLKGGRIGLRWIVGLFVGLTALYALQEADWLHTAYTSRELGGVFAPLLLVSLLLGVIESVRAEGEARIAEQAATLAAAKRHLSEKIEEQQRTQMALERSRSRLNYLAYYDELTGLANRHLFFEHLDHTLAVAKRMNQRVGLLYLDLDRFKQVNDTHGHRTGDLLLTEVAARTRNCLRASDLMARLGGDEFVVLLPEITDAGDLAVVTGKIRRALLPPFTLGAVECTIDASIGAASYPGDAGDAVALVAAADRRMYMEKHGAAPAASPGRDEGRAWRG
ncbi:diguanylate cyclase (GGDEF)-like protein [Plasticicumulans lactativorans]|uniref:Diguanylate cyclase (GGDEF)-like protein n=1 Tax=Plasticicumulans lactativorans TaxID=1133106 RepID=A0A4R2L4U3_9GAMM|nr:GGDEF domain-containing protein [Plasticicumulans lactativorans]TCO78866.1 diguanylate cyclase (GGDEF)-like protein [Plasticicumulans lactativorans]